MVRLRSACKSAPPERDQKVCDEVIAPLVEADGGEMFLVALDDRRNRNSSRRAPARAVPAPPSRCGPLIEPAIHAVSPGIRVKVTCGLPNPRGGRRARPPRTAAHDRPVSAQLFGKGPADRLLLLGRSQGSVALACDLPVYASAAVRVGVLRSCRPRASPS